MSPLTGLREESVTINTAAGQISGVVALPPDAHGAVIFAHGSGSGRLSPRNRFVAQVLQQAGMATLLVDLLTPAEEERDRMTAQLRFDTRLLSGRLDNATGWLTEHYSKQRFPLGYFGASTGAAAALIAAARRNDIAAVVSRGGRPDLAGYALPKIRAATLLIVGGSDGVVVQLNNQAYAQLTSSREKRLEIVPGATHLFAEPGKLEEVARLASDWFVRHLASPRSY